MRQITIPIAVMTCAFLALALGGVTASAEQTGLSNEPSPTGKLLTGASPRTHLSVIAGVRWDELDWTSSAGITLSGNVQNLRSVLEWDDLRIYQVAIAGGMVWPNRIAVKGKVGYGSIVEGDNQDSDFITVGGVTTEFSRSQNATDDDDVLDATISIGYPYQTKGPSFWTITPVVGFSYHEQNLVISDGNQKIPDSGAFPGLDSTYETQWYGPWVGLDVSLKFRPRSGLIHALEIYSGFGLHWFLYEAEADWNLRADLAHPRSFAHESDGWGYDLNLGANICMTQRWALNVGYAYRDFSSEKGDDTIFFANGDKTTIDLDEVSWRSWSINAGVTYSF